MRLNKAQAEAVEHEQGPLLVLAGAGSGKTRVITQRIARLIERGQRPETLLAVSFTNKSAEEMGVRLAKLVGANTAQRLWLSTFHSFGVRFLREESSALGYGRFVILDQSDGMGLIRELLAQRPKSVGSNKYDVAAILARISRWKNRFVPPDKISPSEHAYDAIAHELYPLYQASLRAMHAVDFDDLVLSPVQILKSNPAIQQKWNTRLRHLLIDEFQDTNYAQLELVRLLANELRNVCVVGDDDQSIYSWRGAEVSNILDFEKHFSGAKVVKLQDNYRSKQPILAVANAVIQRSQARPYPKVLRAVRGPGDRVSVCATDSLELEATFVGAEIRALGKIGIKYSQIAVLYRSNLQARLIEEALRLQGINYRLLGGTQFFDRKEIKDAFAYLRVIAHEPDELSLRRILNVPARGIGHTTVERIEQLARKKEWPFVRALEQIARAGELAPHTNHSIESFVSAVHTARAGLASGHSLAQVAEKLFEQMRFCGDSNTPVGDKLTQKRKENVDFLLRMLERYERSCGGNKPDLLAFLNQLSLQPQTEDTSSDGGVTLATLHTAKGLEFQVVFLIGCVEGQMPHRRTTDPKITDIEPGDLEEERRLFYVGVTRAQDRLYLSHARRKMVRGTVVPLTPSRFLEGLPEEAVERYAPNVASALETDEIADMSKALLAQLSNRTSNDKLNPCP